MSKKIYVGNLSYSTTEDQIEGLFNKYGVVLNVNLVKDRETNQSKGFAFVEMEEDGAAQNAISALNDTEFNGRKLRINEANERKPRRDRNRY